MKTELESLINLASPPTMERTFTLEVFSIAADLPPKKRSSLPYCETTAWSPPRAKAVSIASSVISYSLPTSGKS